MPFDAGPRICDAAAMRIALPTGCTVLALAAAGSSFLMTPPAAAQPAAPGAAVAEVETEMERAVAAVDQPAWTMAMDLRHLLNSPIANSLWESMLEADNEGRLAEFEEKTGLDLREDVGAVVISGSDFEDEDGTVIAELSGDGEKLEAWFTEQPEHRVEELPGGVRMHTFVMQDGAADEPDPDATPVTVALRETPAGVRLISSTNEANTRRLAAADDLEERLAPGRLQGERIFSFRAFSVPEDAAPADMMGGELLNAVRGMELALDSGESVVLDLRLDTADDADAQQMQMQLQGFAGMVPMFAPNMGLTPDQSTQLFTIMQSLSIAAEPAAGDRLPGVRLKLGVPQEVVTGFVEGAAEAAEAEQE